MLLLGDGIGPDSVGKFLRLEGFQLQGRSGAPAQGLVELWRVDTNLREGPHGLRQLLRPEVRGVLWQICSQAREQLAAEELCRGEGPRRHRQAESFQLARPPRQHPPLGAGEDAVEEKLGLRERPDQLAQLERLELVRPRGCDLVDGHEELVVEELHHRVGPRDDAQALHRHVVARAVLVAHRRVAGAEAVLEDARRDRRVQFLEDRRLPHQLQVLGILPGGELGEPMQGRGKVDVIHVRQMHLDGLQQYERIAALGNCRERAVDQHLGLERLRRTPSGHLAAGGGGAVPGRGLAFAAAGLPARARGARAAAARAGAVALGHGCRSVLSSGRRPPGRSSAVRS
mmetsp:Transcript_135435/g.337899  ORF Transcript_135435/g.337899 Transcript_135435/m.337899 type:complete len:343 (+) Transcript_135435:862-1890(+)